MPEGRRNRDRKKTYLSDNKLPGMKDGSRDPSADSVRPGALIQSEENTESDFGWSDLLAVLIVGALLLLVIWYLLYGMGPLPSSAPA